MTTETASADNRLRPRILEIEETGRLDLSLPPATETSLPIPIPRRRGSRSSLAIAATGLGIFVLAVLGIDLVQFIDRAFAHGSGLGMVAVAAVAVGCGGAGYWLVAELRALWRLRSAERLRSLIASAVSSELKSEINSAAAILARDPQLGGAVARFRAAVEPRHSGRDALELFSRFVLAPADRLAETSIRRRRGRLSRSTRSARLPFSIPCCLPPAGYAWFARSPRFMGSVRGWRAPSTCCAASPAAPAWSAPSIWSGACSSSNSAAR